MLLILLFAPYAALLASLALAITVIVVCCKQETQPLSASGFTLRRKKQAALTRAAARVNSNAPRASRSSRKKELQAAAA